MKWPMTRLLCVSWLVPFCIQLFALVGVVCDVYIAIAIIVPKEIGDESYPRCGNDTSQNSMICEADEVVFEMNPYQ